MQLIKPDPSSLGVITLKTAGGYVAEFVCTRCNWQGSKVAARRCREDRDTIETFCPECLAEARYVHMN
jgi:predicted amidophosphoribosyltransferase